MAYNLGLVHLSTGQAASAFHYFSTAINLKPEFAHRYGCKIPMARPASCNTVLQLSQHAILCAFESTAATRSAWPGMPDRLGPMSHTTVTDGLTILAVVSTIHSVC